MSLSTFQNDHNPYILYVRFICKWYTSQRFVVKWSSIVSNYKPFSATNGVRQGCILSPVLLSIYMDDLSNNLLQLKTGCYMENNCMNHLFFA